MDPEEDQQVGPDLGPNCLQRLSADNTSRQLNKRLNNAMYSCYELENVYLIRDLDDSIDLMGGLMQYGSNPQTKVTLSVSVVWKSGLAVFVKL